jgi:hypothetical protein
VIRWTLLTVRFQVDLPANKEIPDEVERLCLDDDEALLPVEKVGNIDQSPPPGANTVIFGQAVYFSCFLNKRKPVSNLLLSAMVALYAMSTAHFAVVFYNIYQGLVRIFFFFAFVIRRNILFTDGSVISNWYREQSSPGRGRAELHHRPTWSGGSGETDVVKRTAISDAHFFISGLPLLDRVGKTMVRHRASGIHVLPLVQ